jgi:glycerol kinase
MEEDIKHPIKSFKVDGGATVNQFLMQFQSDIIGLTVERPVIMETTALGAAYFAGLATKYWDSMEDIQKSWKLKCAYEPKMSTSERVELVKGWHLAVESARHFKIK